VDKLRDYAFLGMGPGRAVYTPEWAYLLPIPGRQSEPWPAQLFHRPTDPTQQTNVIAEHPDVAASLELAMWRFVADLQRG
jgi:hypothetical protein